VIFWRINLMCEQCSTLFFRASPKLPFPAPWHKLNFQPQFLVQFSFLHRLTFHKLCWASNNIVQYLHTLYLNVCTLKYRNYICIHVENSENKPKKRKNLKKKPKETIDSGVLTIKFTIISATGIFLRLLLILLVHQLLCHIALQGSSIPVLVLPKKSSYF
jgi:hypothetical protein